MRSRKLLALLFCLITFPAIAGYMTLLGAGLGAIQPAEQATFTNSSYSTNLSNLTSVATFSRAGNAMQFDSSGYLTYGPNNLLTYSNDFIIGWTASNTGTGAVPWINSSAVLDPVGGTNARRLQASRGASNTTADRSVVVQSAASTAAGNYIQAIWVKSNTGLSQTLSLFDSGSGGTVAFTATTTWTQIYAKRASSGVSDFQIGTRGGAYGGDQNIDVLIYAATFSAVTYETSPRPGDQVITTSSAYYGPRIDYDPNTLAVKGLLIEEARTNLLTYSNTYSNAAWTQSAVTMAQNVTGINGIANNAWTLTASAGAANHWFYQTIASSGVTAQIVAKAGTASWLAVGFGGGALVDGVYFNLTNGTKGTSAGGGITSNITPLGNGYYLCQVYKPGVSNHYSVEIHTADAQALSWTAAGTETIIVQNSQLEVGSFATSYIPTAAASVTRAAETVQFTGAALTALQGSAGSVIVQSISEASSSPTAITNVIKGTNSILYRDTTGKTGTTNGTTALLTAAAPTWSSAIRNGLAWSASGRSLGYTSSAIATDANTVSNGGTLYLGSSAGSAVESGWYQSLGIWNQRLPDATLSTKLTVGGPYAANDNANPFAPKFANNDNLPIHWRVAL